MLALDYTFITLVTAAVCGSLLVIQLIYLFAVYPKMHRAASRQAEPPEEPQSYPPLSVIIVTKDSGNILNENLPAILEQDYPEYEVIVVNDQSAGEDEDILKQLENTYSNLYHTFIPQTARYVSRKKLGIAMGIKASRYEWIVVTETTCRPSSNQWLKSLASHFKEGTDVVLGYCRYDDTTGFFGKYIEADNLFQAMRYLGSALNGHPYMGVGKNLAYRKACYADHKGFADHLTLQRGDDDLFVNAVARKGNTEVALETDSLMCQQVPPYKRIWMGEKVGRLVTGHFYRGFSRWMYGFETWTCALFHLTAAIGLALSIVTSAWLYTALFAAGWLTRFILSVRQLRLTAQATGSRLSYLLPLFDLFRPLWALQVRMHYWRRTKSDFLRK